MIQSKFAGMAAALILLGVVSIAGLAHADLNGVAGRIIGIEHNDDSSDDFGASTGSVFVDEGGGTITEYRHGGSLCPGRILDSDQQSMLLDAMRSKLTVLPYHKLGNGGARCLVSFSFVAKKSAAAAVTK
jgi:hypothetical protein